MILSIETTDFCNLNCIMCPPQNERKAGITKSRGNLDYNTFKSIVDSIVINNISIKDVLLHWLGEPFLNPSFFIFLNYIVKSSHHFGRIRFDTNLNTTKEKLDRLLSISNSKVFMSISMDAASERTYKKIRVGGDFNLLINNIKYILNKRKEGPLLGFQFIVMPENYKETQDFIDLCKQLLKNKEKKGDTISIKRESYAKAGKKKEQLDNLYNSTIKRLHLKKGYQGKVYLQIAEELDWGEQ